jgi:hypothetical protein
VRKRPLTLFGECGQSAVVSHRRVASASGPIMAAIQDIVAINPKSGESRQSAVLLDGQGFCIPAEPRQGIAPGRR